MRIEGIPGRLRLPVIGAPMFLVSGPELVTAQCKAGIIGAFPALNARAGDELDAWLTTIRGELAAHNAAFPDRPAAPFAVNQIVHPGNPRLEDDVEICLRHKVPIIITSLQAPGDLCARVHGYGGLVWHDVVNIRHAEKALADGADGLIAVCAGAGGHAGSLSPFALITELRRFFNGPIALSGAISKGGHVAAARAMGADLAYVGTRFIAATESRASSDYRAAVVTARAADIVLTDAVSGVPGNFLRSSLAAAGLDGGGAGPGRLDLGRGTDGERKPWRDIWSAGQSVAGVDRAEPVADIVADLERGYRKALSRLTQG